MNANRRLLTKLALFAGVMFVFAWGLIPVYRVFCQWTGLNQVRAVTPPKNVAVSAPDKPVSINFDANVQPGLPWKITILNTHASARPGQTVRGDFEVTNLSNQRVTGQAVPRYLPAATEPYIHKIQCFCFEPQVFEPGQTRQLMVVFTLDKNLPRQIDDITLSYSMYSLPKG